MSNSKICPNNIGEINKKLRKSANPSQAKLLQRFFKTGKGEYGQGDIFLGIKVPLLRQVAKEYWQMPLKETEQLLCSREHEKRMVALFIMVLQYQREPRARKKIFRAYLKNYKFINNWDLVDVTCPHIVGQWLLNKKRAVLYSLAKSNNLWKKRISLISTFAFIRQNDLSDSVALAEMLLFDKHDLIHKAVGWVLREVGKKDVNLLYAFLDKYQDTMPRTSLRYAIEKLPEKIRRQYLLKNPAKGSCQK